MPEAGKAQGNKTSGMRHDFGHFQKKAQGTYVIGALTKG